jgi:hypothetical protein
LLAVKNNVNQKVVYLVEIEAAGRKKVKGCTLNSKASIHFLSTFSASREYVKIKWLCKVPIRCLAPAIRAYSKLDDREIRYSVCENFVSLLNSMKTMLSLVSVQT